MADWVIDPDHSVATFRVRHMMIADVHGQFNRISGRLTLDPSDMASASVRASIDVSGIYTGIKKRDDHLGSPEFLDAGAYPEITFQSTGAEPNGKNRLIVRGDLSIHGITRTVSMDTRFSGPRKSPFGETSMGFTALLTINREDFGMTWNVPIETGGLMVGHEVHITINVEADRAES